MVTERPKRPRVDPRYRPLIGLLRVRGWAVKVNQGSWPVVARMPEAGWIVLICHCPLSATKLAINVDERTLQLVCCAPWPSIISAVPLIFDIERDCLEHSIAPDAVKLLAGITRRRRLRDRGRDQNSRSDKSPAK